MVCSLLKATSTASFRRNLPNQYVQLLIRPFATSLTLAAPSLPPRPTLPEHDLHHTFLKGSGPGGQKINKTSSAVQMTHLPTGIVVKSQATRSRSQNYKIARQILADKIEFLEKGDESRVAKKQERAKVRKRSREKKARRKYRALLGATEGQVEDRDRSQGELKEAREQTDPVAAAASGERTAKDNDMKI